MCQGLGFLDRWRHQHALGDDLFFVLTLVDEVLHSARMDLWSTQVRGLRIVAGLEYIKENLVTDSKLSSKGHIQLD
jgi:hypothetical protein